MSGEWTGFSFAGGCSRKLEATALSAIVAAAQPSGAATIGLASARDRGDAYELRLHRPMDALMTTVDLLYAFGRDPKLFGRILAIHASSDLYATLAEPLFATLALGVTHQDVSAGRAASITRGVADALIDEGAVLAGGHTAVARDTFATLSVVGVAAEVPPTGTVLAGDLLLLSKPLGSGLAISAERLGVAAGSDLETWYVTMASSNRRAAKALVSVQRSSGVEVRPIRRVTDVSGFGFLNALKQIAGDARLRLDARAVPLGAGVADFVKAQAWSALLDANLVESSVFTAYDHGVDTALMQAVLNDPQTSGGLLAVAAPEALETGCLVDEGPFSVVGEVLASAGGLAIDVRQE